MASKNKARLDYRRLKKMLNPYVKFSFKTPRGGEDFTPQQKSAITRQLNKYGKMITKVKSGEASFIKTKIPGTLNSNRGSFLPYPKVEIKKRGRKGKKIKLIEVRKGSRREVYIPFDKKTINDLDAIQVLVEKWRAKLKPDYIRWATPNQRYSHIYNPSIYTLYLADDFTTRKIDERKKQADNSFFVGVYLGFDPTLRRMI